MINKLLEGVSLNAAGPGRVLHCFNAPALGEFATITELLESALGNASQQEGSEAVSRSVGVLGCLGCSLSPIAICESPLALLPTPLPPAVAAMEDYEADLSTLGTADQCLAESRKRATTAPVIVLEPSGEERVAFLATCNAYYTPPKHRVIGPIPRTVTEENEPATETVVIPPDPPKTLGDALRYYGVRGFRQQITVAATVHRASSTLAA